MHEQRIASLSPEKRRLLALLEAQHRDFVATRPDPDDHRATLERALAEVWAAVLGKAEVRPNDNYFRLGGDSIRSIQIVSLARKRGIVLSTRLLFEHPTIKALAAALADLPPTNLPTDTATQPAPPSSPLTPLQAGILYECRARPDENLYQSYLVLRLEGHVDADILHLAWNKLFLAHPALRTLFDVTAPDGPRQLVADLPEAALTRLDLTGLPGEEVHRKIARLREEMATQLRRVDRAPLFHLALATLRSDRHFLMTFHHHLIIDGWSHQNLLGQLFATYFAYLDGRDAPLPEVPSFATFVKEVCLPRSSPSAFWNSYLAALPPSRLSRQGADERTIVIPVELSDATAARLAGLAAEVGVTAASAFQGVWALALAALCHEGEVVFGLTLSGRDAAEADLPPLDGVVGMCINTLPVRVRLDGGGDVGGWLRTIRDTLLALTENQYAALSELKRRSLGGTAQRLFDTIIVIQNLPLPHVADERLGIAFEAFDVAEGWPIVLVVEPGPVLRLHLRLRPSDCKPGVAEQLPDLVAAAGTILSESATDTPLRDVRQRLHRSLGKSPRRGDGVTASRRTPA